MPEHVTAKVTGMTFQPAEEKVMQGVKDGEVFNKITYEGWQIVKGGYGSYRVRKDSRLIVYIEVEGLPYQMWVERIMEKALGVRMLTAELRQKILGTKPDTIDVTPEVGQRGKKYYTPTAAAASAWAERVKGT